MLLSDSDIIAASDLAQVDSEAVSVAANANPPLTVEGAGSAIRQGWTECAQKITSALQIYSTYLAQPGMTSGHIAAVMNVGVPARTQPRARLNQIVASEYGYQNLHSPIQTWLIFNSLAALYRNASGRLGKDRFEEKFKQYRGEADRQWVILKAQGMPMVYQPMEAPGSVHGFSAGTWGASNISSVSGGSGGNIPVGIAITYYDASKYVSQSNKGNAESSPSAIVSDFILPTNKFLKIDISSLVPPTGGQDAVGTAQGTWLPLNATHWNIYVGQNGGTLWYQASVPIATKTYTFAADPVFSGSPLQNGQYADLNIFFHNLVSRA